MALLGRRLLSSPLRSALLVGVLLTTLVVLTRAQQSDQNQPAFRASAAGVLLDIRVVDDDGQFVRGLSSSDFRVFEDGREQVVSAFEQITLPTRVSTSARSAVEPDISSNHFADDQRLFIIVLDDTSGPSSDARLSESLRAAARAFVEGHLTDSDLVALVSTSGRRDLTVPFTTSRQRLLEAIKKYERGYGQDIVTFTGAPVAGGRLVSDTRTTVTVSLRALAAWLEGLTGRRKSIVLFSFSIDCGISDTSSPLHGQERGWTTEVIQAAGRSNVSIYGMVGGLARNPTLDNLRDQNAREQLAEKLGPQRYQSILPLIESVSSSTPPPSADWGRPGSESCPQGVAAIARDTGGFRGPASAAAFERIISENSGYYLLGYTSTNTGRDDRFRRTEVVARPGLHVIARTGYSVRGPSRPPPRTPTEIPPVLADAIQSPVPVSGIGLNVAAPAFMAGSTGSLHVIVEPDPASFSFTENQNVLRDELELLLVAADIDGKAKATETGTLELRLSGPNVNLVNAYGARLIHELPLKPGRYHLRVAAWGRDSGRSGSVHREIDVPDFRRGTLVLSDVVITSRHARLAPTRGTVDPWIEKLGGPPTAHRVFTPEDELTSYIEIYDNDRSAGGQITVTTSLRSEAGPAITPMTIDERVLERVRPRSSPHVHSVRTPISLSHLLPGRYVLITEATSSRNSRLAVSRHVPFTVE